MTRGSTRAHPRRIKASRRPKLRTGGGKSAPRARRRVTDRPAPMARVRIVRSRSIRAHRPKRPLPPPESLSERMFLGSLERSLRDHRTVWEALAKR